MGSSKKKKNKKIKKISCTSLIINFFHHFSPFLYFYLFPQSLLILFKLFSILFIIYLIWKFECLISLKKWMEKFFSKKYNFGISYLYFNYMRIYLFKDNFLKILVDYYVNNIYVRRLCLFRTLGAPSIIYVTRISNF